jgi:hypothetical protein
MDPALEAALVEEATKKSDLAWIGADVEAGGIPPRPVWHVWAEGALHLVVGPSEQELPGVEAGDMVRVTLRSKDKGGRLVTWRGRVDVVEPGTPAWDTVVPALHAARLNQRDGEEQPRRWAREARVLRVEPVGRPVETPDGAMPTGSGAAPVPPSPRTTTRRAPRMVGGLRRARRQARRRAPRDTP